MTRSQRVAALGMAAVVMVVAAFVVLRPDEESADSRDSERAGETTASQSRVRLADGRPVGGVATVSVDRGDEVLITVEADSPNEVHLHGYDIEHDAVPGRPARFDFTAELEGIFELESHTSNEQLVRLVVEPQ